MYKCLYVVIIKPIGVQRISVSAYNGPSTNTDSRPFALTNSLPFYHVGRSGDGALRGTATGIVVRTEVATRPTANVIVVISISPNPAAADGNLVADVYGHGAAEPFNA